MKFKTIAFFLLSSVAVNASNKRDIELSRSLTDEIYNNMEYRGYGILGHRYFKQEINNSVKKSLPEMKCIINKPKHKNKQNLLIAGFGIGTGLVVGFVFLTCKLTEAMAICIMARCYH